MIWLQPPSTLYLPDDTIHIWRSYLGVSPGQRQAYHRLLNAEESERAEHYRFEEPRNRFVVTRGILRYLLSRYTQCTPEMIAFDMNAWGKPSLAAGVENQLEFNVAHSNNLALYAFSRNRCVGIDVEFVHLIEDVDHLVSNFFSDYEQQMFKMLPESMQLQAFLAGWTRKEAYVKGCGKGLSIPLNAFDVCLHPGEPATLLTDRTDDTAVQQWNLLDIPVGNGYIAAIAIGGGQKTCEVHCFNFNVDND